MNWKTGLMIVALLFGVVLLLPGIKKDSWWVIHPSRIECTPTEKTPEEVIGILEKGGSVVYENTRETYFWDTDPWKNGRRIDIIHGYTNCYAIHCSKETTSIYRAKEECEADKAKGYVSWIQGL